MTSEGARDSSKSPRTINVAIIGAGIVGLHVALGLIKRNIPVTVYEQAPEIKSIGAGIGLYHKTIECMEALDPRLRPIISKIGFKANNSARWINGCTEEDLSLRPADKLYDIEIPSVEGEAAHTCHRVQLMTELLELLPSECLCLGKRLEGIEQQPDTQTVKMKFADQTEAEADAGKFVYLTCNPTIGIFRIESAISDIVL